MSTRGEVSDEFSTGNWHTGVNHPQGSEVIRRVGASLHVKRSLHALGLPHDSLTFWRRFVPPQKWLGIGRDLPTGRHRAISIHPA